MGYPASVTASSLPTFHPTDPRVKTLKCFQVLAGIVNSLKPQAYKLHTCMPKCRAERESPSSFMENCDHNTVYAMGRWLASSIGVKSFAGCILQNGLNNDALPGACRRAHVLHWTVHSDNISYYVQDTSPTGFPGMQRAIVLLEACHAVNAK